MRQQFADIIGDKIEDIILTGCVFEKNGVLRFVPNFDRVYLVLPSKIVKFNEIEADLSIEAELVSEITFSEEFQLDEKPSQISIGHIVLLDTLMRNKISQIVLYGGKWTKIGNYRFNGISIFLEFGQEIFLDSCSTLGLNIGAEPQRLLWLQNGVGFPDYDVSRSDSWPSEASEK